ncbi:MAG: hypothetical protein ACE5EQ_10985 [Phycisphaerae bacterium]
MDEANNVASRLIAAARVASARFKQPTVSEPRLDDALTGAIDPQKLIDNLAEAWRTGPDEARALLEEHGFGGILARLQPKTDETGTDEAEAEPLCTIPRFECAAGRIAVRAWNPALNATVRAPGPVLDTVSSGLNAFLSQAKADPLGVLYRDEPLVYARQWISETAPQIDTYVQQHFGASQSKYLVNSGIGANEQFNYFVSTLANARPDRSITWLMANSPKEIVSLPPDAREDNTLFMEFSRSGITQETVKLHELTPRGARRIVFANGGPLHALGERDGNLVLPLPAEVSGRYGRNKTPILMAPMHVAGLDAAAYWSDIQTACDTMDLSDRSSLPVVLAQYIRIQQLRRGINHIYLGTNDSLLRYSADEFCQFWNEGVNRDGNDMTMSRYLGLPRDSHMNLEAILGTSERKLAVFLVYTGNLPDHPMLSKTTDPLEPEHEGLTPSDVDLVLTLANVKRCSEKMPTILITINRIDLTTSAWLGQLGADITLVYSRLIGVDPGSNPEVKAVRTRASEWLADRSGAMGLLGRLD